MILEYLRVPSSPTVGYQFESTTVDNTFAFAEPFPSGIESLGMAKRFVLEVEREECARDIVNCCVLGF